MSVDGFVGARRFVRALDCGSDDAEFAGRAASDRLPDPDPDLRLLWPRPLLSLGRTGVGITRALTRASFLILPNSPTRSSDRTSNSASDSCTPRWVRARSLALSTFAAVISSHSITDSCPSCARLASTPLLLVPAAVLLAPLRTRARRRSAAAPGPIGGTTSRGSLASPSTLGPLLR